MKLHTCMRAWTLRRTFNTVNINNINNKTLAVIKTMVFFMALVPLVRIGLHAYQNELGANPIEKITRTTGYWALTFLMATLSATPMRHLLGWSWLIRLRRMLGLFAFFYACLHFSTYLVLDQYFDWESILKDIAKRPYITVGFPSFLAMIPLAVTSTDAMIRRLGGKRWRKLHRLVYLCAIGGVIHYWWLVKKDLTTPFTFAILLALLLGYRLLHWLWSFRKQRFSANTASFP